MIARAKTITSAPQKMALLADNEICHTSKSKHVSMHHSERATASMLPSSPARRRHSMVLMLAGASGGSSGFGAFFSGLFDNGAAAAADVPGPRNEIINSGKGPTNDIITSVNGIRHRRLGGSDIVVSELGLGTQRWVSTDFNAPNKEQVFEFMDKAILGSGVNLIDTVSSMVCTNFSCHIS